MGCAGVERELGIDLAPLFAEFGMDPKLRLSPRGYLAHATVVQLFEEAARRFDCENFAFYLGRHHPAMELGPVGQLMQLAPTLGAGLEYGVRYLHFYSEGPKHALVREENTATVRRWDAQPYEFSVVQMHVFGIVQLYNVIKALCGDQWRPLRICFAHSAPDDTQPLAHYFGVEVLYNQAFDGVVFNSQDLSTPISTADPELLSILRRHYDSAHSEWDPEADIAAQVDTFIRQRLGNRHCNLEGCAQFLGLSSKTLQRRLAERNKVFKEMLLDVRMQTARQQLRKSHMSLSKLSIMLGYRNQSAFSRSFKQQHGVNPEHWRYEVCCKDKG